MKKLYFNQFPSVFLYMSILDNLDRTIINLVLDSPEQSRELTLRFLELHTQSGKNSITYSLKKLVYIGILKVKPTRKANGQDSVNIYTYNPNYNQWVLTSHIRKILNTKESIESVGEDWSDHKQFILMFEFSQKSYLRKYVGNTGEVKKEKASELEQINNKWTTYYKLQLGEELNGTLDSLEGKVVKDLFKNEVE